MKITSVKYADSFLPESWVFKGGSDQNKCPISFIVFLIETQSKRILVDAGCETMPDFNMKDFISPMKALENIGVSADSITDLIITHAHHDHIACARYFKNATIYIQKDEYEKGKGYLKDCPNITTFDEEYTVCEHVKVIKIGGHSIGSCIVEIESGKKTYVITGDECYLKKCLEIRSVGGSPYNPEKSREFVEKYSGDRYITIVSHDPDIIKEIVLTQN